MAGGNWFSDRLEDIGDYIVDTWEGDRLFGIPKDAPIRENILDPLASWVTAPPPGWTDTPTGQPSWGGFQYNPPEYIQEIGAQFTSPAPPPPPPAPNRGAATVWDAASQSWIPGFGYSVDDALRGAGEPGKRIDPATGEFVYPPNLLYPRNPNAPVGSMDSTTDPADRNLFGLPSVQPPPPSSAELTTQLFDMMRNQNKEVFDAEIARLDKRESDLAQMYGELEQMALDGVNGAAEDAAAALAAMETTRLERLRVDEAAATARLAELEAARVEQEDRVNTKIKKRGDDLIAAYDSTVADVAAQSAERGLTRTDPVNRGAAAERALLQQQATAQQNLTDRLSQATAEEAVGRGMDLAAMYDQANMDLMDRLASQRSANAAAQQQQLLAIQLAAQQGNIDRYIADSDARGAAASALASGLGQVDLAQLQGQLQGTQAGEQAGLLEALLGIMPGTLSAADSFGLTDNVFDLVTDDPEAGKTPYELADGTKIMVDNETAARLSAAALSEAQQPKVQMRSGDGAVVMASPSQAQILLGLGWQQVG